MMLTDNNGDGDDEEIDVGDGDHARWLRMMMTRRLVTLGHIAKYRRQ